MSSNRPTDTRLAWKHELRPTEDCIAIERLGEELTPAEHSHLAHCARCQTEMSLWSRMNAGKQTQGESEAVDAIANELRSRLAPPSNVVAMPQRKRSGFRPALAAAALVVIAIAIGVFVQTREPAIEGPTSAVSAYRSATVSIVAPTGDVSTPPASLSWKPVGGASQYEAAVMEVDRNVLWRGSTRNSRIELPPAVVAQFVPGKTLLWQVQARRDKAIVADSGIQRFRVSVTR